MKTNINKEKLLSLVTQQKSPTAERNNKRIKDRKMLRESRSIALKILTRLDELKWTKKRLADEFGVKPQQITKITSGKENLTLETLVKLQEVLGISILSTFEENRETQILNVMKYSTKKQYRIPRQVLVCEEKQSTPIAKEIVKRKRNSVSFLKIA